MTNACQKKKKILSLIKKSIIKFLKCTDIFFFQEFDTYNNPLNEWLNYFVVHQTYFTFFFLVNPQTYFTFIFHVN